MQRPGGAGLNHIDWRRWASGQPSLRSPRPRGERAGKRGRHAFREARKRIFLTIWMRKERCREFHDAGRCGGRIGATLEGRGEIADFRLSSAGNKAELRAETLPFSIAGGAETFGMQDRKNIPSKLAALDPHIEFGPVAIGPDTQGRDRSRMDQPRRLRSRDRRRGRDCEDFASSAHDRRSFVRYRDGRFRPDGSTHCRRMDRVGRWIRIRFCRPPSQLGPKLRNVQIAARGVGGPVEIVSADMTVSPDRVRVTKLNAKAAGTNWSGSLEMPRGCIPACPVKFALNANQIALSQITEWASPGPKKRPWYRVLDSNTPSGPSVLASLKASGHITADQLLIHDVAAKHLSANVALNSGKLELSEVDADFVGGKHRGEWVADFGVKPADLQGPWQVLRSLTGRICESYERRMDIGYGERWLSNKRQLSRGLLDVG